MHKDPLNKNAHVCVNVDEFKVLWLIYGHFSALIQGINLAFLDFLAAVKQKLSLCMKVHKKQTSS